MFINITIDLAVKICTISIPVFLVLYFIVFRKYNKRNNISLNDIIFDAIEFLTNSVIHLLILIIGVDYMIEGLHLLDAIYERYANFIVGVLIISVVIYHYISFIKKLLVDLDPEVVKKEKETNYKFGEYVLFVFLCLLLINPILSLPKFAMHIGFKDVLIKEVLTSLGCTVVSIFLLYQINPLNIRKTSKEDNVKEVLIEEVNEKVEFEDTGYEDLNKIGDKVEEIMNESTLNAPDKEKIVIPDEVEIKPKKKTSKNNNSKTKSNSNSNSKKTTTSSKSKAKKTSNKSDKK